MHIFEEKVKKFIDENNMFDANPVIAGVSGGADSVCLLLVLNKLGYKTVVAHINHNLRGDEAKRDEDFVRALAEKHNLPFELLSADINEICKREKISCETAGRNVRYSFFSKLSQKYHTNSIAVAHNKNDSAETVIINLIRGSAISGLKGIASVNGNIKRPLLCAERCEIEKYLSDIGQSYVTDSTNNENIYTRNIVRNDILKMMSEINPNIVSTIYDNTKVIFEENNFIEKTTDIYEAKYVSKENGSLVFDTKNVCDICIKKRIIARCAKKFFNGKGVLTSHHINAIASLNSGKKFIFASYLTVINNCGKLWFIANEENKEFCLKLNTNGLTSVPEINEVFESKFITYNDYANSKDENNSIFISCDEIDSDIFIRNKRNGDKFQPYGMTGTQSIKKYFSNLKIPQNMRCKIPIIAAKSEIMAVFPYRIDRKFAIDENTEKILKITKLRGDKNEFKQ